MTLAPPALPVLISEGGTDFGNTLATAFALPLSAVVTGRVGGTDQADWFAIDMPTGGRLSLRLDGLSSDIDLQLLNATGAVVRSSVAGSTTPESILADLAPGLWHVRAYPWSGSSDYRLSVEVLTPQEGTPGNDTI